MRAVNLLPKDDARHGGDGAPVAALVAVSCAVFVASVLGAGAMFEAGKLKKAQTELRGAQAEVAALPAPPPARSATDSQLASQQDARLAALSTALSRRVAWDRILREISLVLPDDVFLQSLKAKSPASGSNLDPPPTPTAAATAQGLVIQGTTYSHDSVARLLSRLEVIPDLTNVQLVDSSQASIGRTHVAHFVIGADVRMPGSSS